MGFSNTRALPYIRTYGEANHFFVNKNKPPRSKKWSEYQRPLKDTSSYHYRIEQGHNAEFYDVVLYHTIMARFYRPDADGFTRTFMRGHSSVTSHSFISNVLGWWQYKTVPTTTGDEVVAPLYDFTDGTIRDRGDEFSLLMVRDKDGFLDVARSQHKSHYKYVSTPEDKARRKEAREKLRTFVMLASLRLPEYIDNVDLTYNAGRPFGGNDHSYAAQYTWRRTIENMLEGEVQEDELEVFFDDIGQVVFNNMASKRGYAQDNFTLARWYSGHKASAYSDLEKPITEKEFENALLNTCLRLANVDRQSGREELPQFIKQGELPRTNIHV